MSRLEYRLSALALRIVGWLAGWLPVRDRVVLASPRTGTLEGNLRFLEREIRARRPDLPIVLLLETYSYGFVGKLRYVLRVMDRVQGNKALAARILGFDRKTLYRKLERYGVGSDDK